MELFITRERVEKAAETFREYAPDFEPEVGIILGSGMGQMAEDVEDAVSIPFTVVPNMVPATVHKGRFVLGTLAGKKCIVMQGRLHPYEGHPAQQIAFPVYAMKALGIKTLIVTNAAGGIDPSYEVGDLMLISDHINFQFRNPIVGPVPEMGPRFYDMTNAYAPYLRTAAKTAAADMNLKLREGVYIGDLGPSFETPAEIRAFKMMGADAVGESTVQEVIAAKQLDLPVLGISLISNPAAGVSDEPLSIDDVVKAANVAAGKMQALIENVLRLI